MDKMEWATWAIGYLTTARAATHADFNAAMNELREYSYPARTEDWYSSCKNIISTLYHFSMEFLSDPLIPGSAFASPDVFEDELTNYRAFVQGMKDELDAETKKYMGKHKLDGPPTLVFVAMRQVDNVIGALDYVRSKIPDAAISSVPEDPVKVDVDLVASLARRFHESVLSLSTHPHGGTIFTVKNEWDSQYLFRAILAAYFIDIRDEEWNPSVAGSAARCEFFLKPLRTMIELKYVRKASDAKKVKAELAVDFLDYGANPLVDHVVCLVYDPNHALKNPTGLMSDLSGPKQGIDRVEVVISPPRV